MFRNFIFGTELQYESLKGTYLKHKSPIDMNFPFLVLQENWRENTEKLNDVIIMRMVYFNITIKISSFCSYISTPNGTYVRSKLMKKVIPYITV
jgi:hypothetical protein